ncbi:hypothetical protein D3C78_663010 [compost metagenome]
MQGEPGGRLFVLTFDITLGLFTNAQVTEQGVGGQQLAAEDFSQFATGQAADDFHLKQAVLGMHIAQSTVQVDLVVGLDVRHTSGVITHTDRSLQAGQCYLALALRQLTLHIPVTATSGRGNDHSEEGQAALHQDSLYFLADVVVR